MPEEKRSLASAHHAWPVALAPAVLLLAVLFAYANALRAPLLFDDRIAITENPALATGNWIDALTPVANSTLGGRPVASVTFALDHWLGGTAPWIYHATNIGIHLACTLLAFGLVRRTLNLPTAGNHIRSHAVGLAFAIALVWAVHPLQTEAVSYISQRTELLMALFYLLTLYALVRAETDGHRGWHFAAVAACALGMASKQTMVTAPVTALGFDALLISGSVRAAGQRHRELYLGLGATWLVAAFCLRGIEHQDVGFSVGVPWPGYAWIECKALGLYLARTIWPHPLIFDYGPTLSAPFREVIPFAFIAAAAGAATVTGLRRAPKAAFLGVWFFLLLSPTSSIVPIRLQPIAESRAYLPSLAVVAAIVLTVWSLGRHLARPTLAAVAAALIATTSARNGGYRDAITLWSRTVADAPANPRAQYCLGVAYAENGNTAAATAAYEAALRLDGNYGDAHCNLGNLLLGAGAAAKAIGHYEAALRANPRDGRTHSNLGIALLETGHTREALPHFQAATELYSNDPDYRYNFGVALKTAGQAGEARAQFEAALRIDPGYDNARAQLKALAK